MADGPLNPRSGKSRALPYDLKKLETVDERHNRKLLERIIKAQQENNDSLHGDLVGFMKQFNALARDFQFIADYLGVEVDAVTSEPIAATGAAATPDHDDLDGVSADDHHVEDHDHTGTPTQQLDHGLALTGLSDDDHPQYALDTDLSDHTGDPSDAHDASAISVLDTAGQYTATDVEAALAEVLDAEQAHEADASAAHAASAVSNTPAGTVAATDVQGAIDELATDYASADSTHAGAADPHTGYRLESADHSHASTGLQAGQLDHGTALTGLTDDDHTQYILKAIFDAKGDLISASAADTPVLLGVGTDGYVLTADSGETSGLAWSPASGASAADVQVFTSGGTWNKPSGKTIARVIAIGAGGSGGTGRSGSNNTDRGGGGGGGGGAIATSDILISALGSTESVTVGTGGAAVTDQETADTNGSVGNAGGASFFGTSGSTWTHAAGGAGGDAGTAAPGGAGGAGGLATASKGHMIFAGNDGGTTNLSGKGGAGGSQPSVTTARGCPGGGAGGAVNSSNIERTGGDGGAQGNIAGGSGDTGGGGGTGGAGTAPTSGDYRAGSGGGGGGGGQGANAAGAGGAGANYGAGGGGGGAHNNATPQAANSGAGGGGLVVVISY